MTKRVWIAPLAVALMSTASVPAALAATTSSSAVQQQKQISSKINDLNDQNDELSDQEQDLFKRLKDISDRQDEIKTQTATLQAAMDQAQQDMSAAQAAVDVQVRAETDARAKLDVAQTSLDASAQKMKEQAIAAYVGGQSNANLANFVLRADDMRDVSAASEYTSQVADLRRQTVEQNRELKGQAADLAAQITAARGAAEAARGVVAARQADLNNQKGQLDSLNAQAAAEANAQSALVAEVESKKGEINDQIASLQVESDNIAAQLRAADNSGVAPSGNGSLTNPVPGARMTSNFGMRVNPVTGVYTLHAGQDFGVPIGTPIHAAAAGKVISAGVVSGYGNYTCINHGGGLATCYAHQSQILVSVGQTVNRNQVIGVSGNTGNSTGPHLHFEVRINGTPVNPLAYL